MTDERDKPGRKPHRDHARPATPSPHAMEQSGECEGIVTDPIDPDDTPIPELIAMVEHDVGILSGRDKQIIRSIEAHRKRGQERRAKLPPPPSVEVDPHAFTPDLPNIEWGRKIETRLAALETPTISVWRARLRNLSIGGLIAALLWTVRALDQRGAESEKTRQRNEQVEQNKRDIRALQDWRIGIDVLMGIRRAANLEPPRNEP